MRIGIDARAAVEQPGGRGRVVRELARALTQQDHDHEFVLFARRAWEGAELDERFRWELSPLRDPVWHVRAATVANRACDVVLSTNSYLTAWFLTVPSVVFVHDLIAYRPELMPHKGSRRIELATLPLAVRRARTLLCNSQATADDLITRFPRAAGKVETVLLGVDPAFTAAQDDLDVRTRHQLDKPYVLAVGTLEPRKNLPRLIEAFAALPDDLRDAHELVLVGATGWDTQETLAAIAAHGVRRLGYVPDAELPALYAGAALFAYPSIYEGFGLPVLEAMAAGTSVLTSNVSSLPEVAGDAAFYCDPLDADSIRDGLVRGLTDPRAAELAHRGRERARPFTWDSYARETVAVLERAARS